jgi:urease accessory protein
LASFVAGRLRTAGTVAAALAAAAAFHPGADSGRRLDAEADARTASPALRLASRQQGKGFVRAATWAFGDQIPTWLRRDSRGPHHPIAVGAVAGAIGLGPDDAARLVGHGMVTGSATAGVRLLGLDPFAVSAMVVGLSGAIEAVVTEAVAAGVGDLAGLPSCSAPLLDIGAEHHAMQEARLFAS